MFCRKCSRTGEKYEPQTLEAAFADGLNDGGFACHFGQRAGSYLFIYESDFPRGETALFEPIFQIFSTQRGGSGDGHSQRVLRKNHHSGGARNEAMTNKAHDVYCEPGGSIGGRD